MTQNGENISDDKEKKEIIIRHVKKNSTLQKIKLKVINYKK